MATNGVGDLRLALRTLIKERGLAALAIVTLALGIGANTAIFSVIDAVLLKPLPYPNAERLVQVWNTYPLMDLPQASVSIPDYFDRREGVEAFDESALYHYVSVNLAGHAAGSAAGGSPERVIGVRATASLFPLLQARAEIGRVFTPAEDTPGEEHVAVLSHHLWKRAFGGDPTVVGREVRLNGEGFRVVGVMPESFAFPQPRVDLWTPFAPTPEQRSDDQRGHEFSQMVARLAPGPTREEGVRLAQQQIDAIHEHNKERFPDVREFWETSGFGGLVVPLKEERFGHLRPLLLLLQGVVALVLLIACVNVANLMLTRLSRRQRELAVRTALGADRWSLTRLLLIESLVLALAGGVAGIALGIAGARTLPLLAPDLLQLGGPAGDAGSLALRLGLDPTVLAFTLGLAVLTGLLFGLAPVVSLWRSETSSVLRDESRGAGSSRRASRLRQSLVVTEMALALVLLAGSGLLLRTFWTLQTEDPGFDRQGVLTARVALPDAKYPEPGQVAAFFERSLEAVRALPGVRSAGLVSDAPFSGRSSSASYQVVGYETAPDEPQPHGLMRVVDEDYFETMGITLLAGRTFGPLDDADAEPVVVVDRRLVEKYFDGSDPSSAIDGRLSRGGGDDAPTYRIVGVVAPVKVQTLDKPITKETVYLPYRQAPSTSMTYVLRTAGDPEALAEPLRRTLLSVDPEQPVFEIRTLSEQIGESLSGQRISMVLVALFGALSLVLSAVGIYGVLAFSTAQREREIGTRMALGASTRKILRLVVGQGLALSLIGAAIGGVVAIGFGWVARSMLFGVEPWDPATYLAAAGLLLTVALLACYRPAKRAAEVDPAEALRGE